MSTGNPIMLLSTNLGVIAISLDDVAEGRRAADELLDTQKEDSANGPAHKPLVDAERIAELFAMDATWFLTRARENRIPHVRLGKYVRFDPDEIRDFFRHEADRHAY